MDMNDVPSVRTLGTRLAEEARRLQARRVPVPDWLGPLTLVMQHLRSLPVPSGERFQGIEATISSPFQTEAGSFFNQWNGTFLGDRPRSDMVPNRQGSARAAARSVEQRSDPAAHERPTSGSTRLPVGVTPTSEPEPLAVPWPDTDPLNVIRPPAKPEPSLTGQHSSMNRQRVPGQLVTNQRNKPSRLRAQMPVPRAGLAASGQPLPPEVDAPLRAMLGRDDFPSIDVRVHDDEQSHALTSQAHADALTIGQHIYFRQGQFQPRERRSQALLAHEMVHVLNAMRPDRSWKRATASGRAEEESTALAVERQGLVTGSTSMNSQTPDLAHGWPEEGARRQPALPPMPGRAVTPARQVMPSAPTIMRPMAAEMERDLRSPQGNNTPAPSGGPQTFYHDLKRQIQIEFERGG